MAQTLAARGLRPRQSRGSDRQLAPPDSIAQLKAWLAQGPLFMDGAAGSAAIQRAANPTEPGEALALARRLLGLFGDRLYLELDFHGRAVDKLVNRGLVALSERLEIPVVATNAVRYATRKDALPAAVLSSMRRGAGMEGLLGSGGVREVERRLTLDVTDAHALRSGDVGRVGCSEHRRARVAARHDCPCPPEQLSRAGARLQVTVAHASVWTCGCGGTMLPGRH